MIENILSPSHLLLILVVAQGLAVDAPAIAPADRRAARPLLILAPALFATGVGFAYFLVLRRRSGSA